MKVKDLIRELIIACGDKNPGEVDVVLLQYNHGPDWPDVRFPVIGSHGGGEHKFAVIIK